MSNCYCELNFDYCLKANWPKIRVANRFVEGGGGGGGRPLNFVRVKVYKSFLKKYFSSIITSKSIHLICIVDLYNSYSIFP